MEQYPRYSAILCCPSQPPSGHRVTRFAAVFAAAAFTLIAIALFTAPPPDMKQLSEVNVQALIQHVHDLTDTTPAVPYWLQATTKSWPRLMASGGVLFPLRSPVATPASAMGERAEAAYRRTATARPA